MNLSFEKYYAYSMYCMRYDSKKILNVKVKKSCEYYTNHQTIHFIKSKFIYS